MIKRFTKASYLALKDTINHDGIEHAGYLAFLILLSLFPFVVFFVALVGYLGQEDLHSQLNALLLQNEILPDYVKTAIQPRIDEIMSKPPQGLLTLAIVGAIWTASSAVEGLKTILNRAYRVSTPPAYIWRRLMSIIQFLLITLAIVVSMLLLIFVPIFWDQAKVTLEINDSLIKSYWIYIHNIITTATLFLAVCSLYYVIPNIKQRWRSVAPGALVVLLLWFAAGSTLSMYIGNFEQVHIIYGSLGSIIATLLFFYITAMIFIYGAELNYRLEKLSGSVLQQKE